MARLCIVIETSDGIGNLNSKALRYSEGNPREGVNEAINYLNRCIGKACSSSIQVTSRDTDPDIQPSGTDSQQLTYTLGTSEAPPSPTPPGPFAILSAESLNTSVSLEWEESEGADSYTISYGTSTGDYPTEFSTSATSPTVVTGLTNKTEYFFMVTAVNSDGETQANEEISATPDIELLSHWDPTQGVTLDQDIIISIDNQVVGGPLLEQPDETKRPLLTQYNGVDAIAPNEDTYLQFTLPETLDTFTVMAYVMSGASANGRTLFGTQTTAVAPRMQYGATVGRLNIQLTPGGTAAQGSVNTANSQRVLAMRYNGTQIAAIAQPGQAATSAAAGVKLTQGDIFFVGGRAGGVSIDGQMGDIKIYRGAATTDDFNAFLTEMQTKYEI